MIDNLYHFLALGIDLLALAICFRFRTFRGSMATVAFAICGYTAAASLLSLGSFHLLRLLSTGWLIHFPIVVFLMSLLVFIGKKKKSRSLGITLFAISVLVGLISVDAFIIEPNWLQVTRYEIQSQKITKPLTLAIVADLQTDRIGRYERSVFQKVMSAEPDLVLFAGDYLQMDAADWNAEAAKLKPILNELDQSIPLGLFAVGGNTDDHRWKELFEDTRAVVLRKTHRQSVDELSIVCLSIQSSFDDRLQISRDAESTSEKFQIILGHAPDFSLGKNDADLLVAGHTHGGQVQLPFFGPIITLSRVPRSWATGLTQIEPHQTLIVSRGIGMERGDAPRIRFFCRPELVIVELQPKP